MRSDWTSGSQALENGGSFPTARYTLDVRYLGAEPGARDVTPGDGDAVAGALAEIDLALQRAELDALELAAAPHHGSVLDVKQRRRGSPVRDPAARRERERERDGARQATLQVERQTVARDHVEADSGQDRDPGALSLAIELGERLEDGDLSGDVEVVAARGEAGLHHRPRRLGEGAGAVQDAAHAFERAPERCRSEARRRASRAPDARRAAPAERGHAPKGWGAGLVRARVRR